MGLGLLSPRGLFLESHTGSLRVVHDTRHRSFRLARRISSMSTVKDGGRNDRLSWSKRAEHRLQEELKEIALKRCDDSVAKFAACAKEKGMLVVFSCREQNKLMNECLNKHTNKDSFERYKMERELELHRAGLAEQSSG